MYKNYRFTAIILLLVVLCGCTSNSEVSQAENNAVTLAKVDNTEIEEEYITVSNKRITVNEIVAQIPDTINNELYYGGNHFDSNHMFWNKNLILNKNLEYDLYSYYPPSYSDYVLPSSLPEVRLVFKDVEHPLSTDEEPKLYYVAIKVTENGLQSRFFSGYHISETETPGEFLGSYSLCINEVITPNHEPMSDEWKINTKKALSLYMDENNFSSRAEHNLETGNYKVYIKGFSANDTHTKILFEHENGNVYGGFYYFVHDISGESSADLNKVMLVENVNSESFRIYLERVKENAAFTMEYAVHQQPGL